MTEQWFKKLGGGNCLRNPVRDITPIVEGRIQEDS